MHYHAEMTTLTYSQIAIIGAGAMGRGIAQIAAQAGSTVLLHDVSAAAIAQAITSLHSQWDKLQDKGRLSADAVAACKSRLLAAEQLIDLADCQLVVEAVVERLDIKRQLFADLEQVLSPEAVLASNTSSLSITESLSDR